MLSFVVEVMLKKNKAWAVTDVCTTNLLVMLLLFMSRIWLTYMKVKLILQFFSKLVHCIQNCHTVHAVYFI